MGGGVGEEREDAHHLKEGAGPAVGEEQGDWSGAFSSFVDEMDCADGGLEAEVMERGETLDLGGPTELVAPVAADLFEGCAVEAVLPGGAGDLVGPAGAGETILEIGDLVCEKREGKRSDSHRFSWYDGVRVKARCEAKLRADRPPTCKLNGYGS